MIRSGPVEVQGFRSMAKPTSARLEGRAAIPTHPGIWGAPARQRFFKGTGNWARLDIDSTAAVVQQWLAGVELVYFGVQLGVVASVRSHSPSFRKSAVADSITGPKPFPFPVSSSNVFKPDRIIGRVSNLSGNPR